MPKQPTVTRISSLRGLGVFGNYVATAELPEFRRYNLIYGFNGSGKTTLSRVFASLEAGTVSPELPEGGTFKIELSDRRTIRSSAPLDDLKGRLLVFNIDFMERNLRWKDGTANPVLILGEIQAELSAKLEKVADQRAAAIAASNEALSEQSRSDTEFAEYKRDVARLIGEETGLARTYRASNLDADYQTESYESVCILSDDKRQELKAIIFQETPLPKREELDTARVNLTDLVDSVHELLETTLGTIAVEELRDHESMVKWVREGLDYHQVHELSDCLFCGNSLTHERKAALTAAIDDRFDKITNEIVSSRFQANSLREQFSYLSHAIPSINDISNEHRSRFKEAVTQLHQYLAVGQETATSILVLLEKKASVPNIVVDPYGLMIKAEALEWEHSFSEQVAEINTIIRDHNRSHDEFTSVQDQARIKLKRHYLAEHEKSYRDRTATLEAKLNAWETTKQHFSALEVQADKLQQQVRQHSIAAVRINGMIRNYLGHAELKLNTVEEGYQIHRSGKPVTGSLSEGEKTAIAICYFLSTLEAEGRKLEDLIVVVDDPISSLDTRALNYAFSKLKMALSGAAQVIILTHNLNFMNEVKKWLKNKTKKAITKEAKRWMDNQTAESEGKNKATATLLFLDVVQSVDADVRCSSIMEMPRHIRDYESEYQYLFYLVLRFLEMSDEELSYFYVMPNALRKVLDIFLAFKVPGAAGLGSKIEAISRDEGTNLDGVRILALERLIQIESHADNLDDLVTYSSMSIEETKDAANALLSLIEALDSEHYEQMRHICRT